MNQLGSIGRELKSKCASLMCSSCAAWHLFSSLCKHLVSPSLFLGPAFICSWKQCHPGLIRNWGHNCSYTFKYSVSLESTALWWVHVHLLFVHHDMVQQWHQYTSAAFSLPAIFHTNILCSAASQLVGDHSQWNIILDNWGNLDFQCCHVSVFY